MDKKIILTIIIILLLCFFYINKETFSAPNVEAIGNCQPADADPNGKYVKIGNNCLKNGCKTNYVNVNGKCTLIGSVCNKPDTGDPNGGYVIDASGQCIKTSCNTGYVNVNGKCTLIGSTCPTTPPGGDLNANYIYNKDGQCIKNTCKPGSEKNTMLNCINLGPQCNKPIKNYDPKRLYTGVIGKTDCILGDCKENYILDKNNKCVSIKNTLCNPGTSLKYNESICNNSSSGINPSNCFDKNGKEYRYTENSECVLDACLNEAQVDKINNKCITKQGEICSSSTGKDFVKNYQWDQAGNCVIGECVTNYHQDSGTCISNIDPKLLTAINTLKNIGNDFVAPISGLRDNIIFEIMVEKLGPQKTIGSVLWNKLLNNMWWRSGALKAADQMKLDAEMTAYKQAAGQVVKNPLLEEEIANISEVNPYNNPWTFVKDEVIEGTTTEEITFDKMLGDYLYGGLWNEVQQTGAIGTKMSEKELYDAGIILRKTLIQKSEMVGEDIVGAELKEAASMAGASIGGSILGPVLFAVTGVGLVLDLLDVGGFLKFKTLTDYNKLKQITLTSARNALTTANIHVPFLTGPFDKIYSEKYWKERENIYGILLNPFIDTPELISYKDKITFLKPIFNNMVIDMENGTLTEAKIEDKTINFMEYYILQYEQKIFEKITELYCTYNNGKILRDSNGNQQCTYSTKDDCDQSYSWPPDENGYLPPGELYGEWKPWKEGNSSSTEYGCVQSTAYLIKQTCEKDGLEYDYDSNLCKITPEYCEIGGLSWKDGNDLSQPYKKQIANIGDPAYPECKAVLSPVLRKAYDQMSTGRGFYTDTQILWEHPEATVLSEGCFKTIDPEYVSPTLPDCYDPVAEKYFEDFFSTTITRSIVKTTEWLFDKYHDQSTLEKIQNIILFNENVSVVISNFRTIKGTSENIFSDYTKSANYLYNYVDYQSIELFKKRYWKQFIFTPIQTPFRVIFKIMNKFVDRTSFTKNHLKGYDNWPNTPGYKWYEEWKIVPPYSKTLFPCWESFTDNFLQMLGNTFGLIDGVVITPLTKDSSFIPQTNPEKCTNPLLSWIYGTEGLDSLNMSFNPSLKWMNDNNTDSTKLCNFVNLFKTDIEPSGLVDAFVSISGLYVYYYNLEPVSRPDFLTYLKNRTSILTTLIDMKPRFKNMYIFSTILSQNLLKKPIDINVILNKINNNHFLTFTEILDTHLYLYMSTTNALPINALDTEYITLINTINYMNLFFSSNLPALFFLLDNPSFIYYLANDDYFQCNLVIYFRNKNYNEISTIFNNYIISKDFSEIKRIIIYKPQILAETDILNELYQNNKLRILCNQDPLNYNNYYCIFTKNSYVADLLGLHLSAFLFFGKNYNYKSSFNNSECYSSSKCTYSEESTKTCSYLISMLYDGIIKELFLTYSSSKVYSFTNYSLYQGFIPDTFSKNIYLFIDSIINYMYTDHYNQSLLKNIDTYMKNTFNTANNIRNGLKGLISISNDEYVKIINTYLLSGTPPTPNPLNLKPLTYNIKCNDAKNMLTNFKVINYLKYISDLSTFIPLNSPDLRIQVPTKYFIDLSLPGVAGNYAKFLELYIMKCI